MTGSINALGSTLLSQYDMNTAPSYSFISLDDGNLFGSPITLGSIEENGDTSLLSIDGTTIDLSSIVGSMTSLNISGSRIQIGHTGIRFWDPNYNVNPFKVTQVNPALNQWESTFRVNSLTVTGSLLAPDITGSLFGTASYAITASYALNSNIPTSGIVTSVNGVLPSPGGNVSVALSATITGNSSSLVISSSGANTGSLTPGTLWVISGDVDPNNNGDAYIYTTSSITGEGQWLVVAPLDVPSADARYILKNGNDSHTGSLSITGSLNMTGSITGEPGVINNLTASYAISSSFAISSSRAVSSSFASTSSFVNPLNQTLTLTGSLITSGSRVRNYRTVTVSTYSAFPTQAILPTDDIILVIDNTTTAAGLGQGNIDITSFLSSPAGRCVEIVKVKDGTGTGVILKSLIAGGLMINNVSFTNGARIICNALGSSITLMSMGLSSTGSAWGNGI